MDAKKCDRCGAFYEAYNQAEDYRKPNRAALVNQTQGICSACMLKIFDLCPECMKLLVAFLGGKEEGGVSQ